MLSLTTRITKNIFSTRVFRFAFEKVNNQNIDRIPNVSEPHLAGEHKKKTEGILNSRMQFVPRKLCAFPMT